MARRNVYGNDWSENGWPMVDEGSCTWVTVPGTNPPVNLEIQNGAPLAIMPAFAADFNAHVQPLRDGDSACWTLDNSVGSSNHLSGTAVDLDWNDHPMGPEYAGYTPAMIAAVRDLLTFYEGMIFWGEDWDTPKDSMHYQMGYGTYDQDADRPDPKCADFIARKVRADGFSIFQRGGAPAPAPTPAPAPASVNLAQILSEAMNDALSVSRYGELVSAFETALRASQCTTQLRVAMFVAQIGEESGGLRYTEEIADGSEYEGRADLGNTQPGDGPRFKGRSWIQITGRSNYTALSRWAFGQGLVPTSTYFVDNPEALASDQYAGLGPAWYWTVARPQINSLCDAGDIEGVTRAINGGLNGLADRQSRYSNALGMGDQLLALIGAPDTGDDDPLSDPTVVAQINDLHNALCGLGASQSIYATPGEGATLPVWQLVRNIDQFTHEDDTETAASKGDFEALTRVARTAAGQGLVKTAGAVARAQNTLVDIEKNDPAVLTAFLAYQKGTTK